MSIDLEMEGKIYKILAVPCRFVAPLLNHSPCKGPSRYSTRLLHGIGSSCGDSSQQSQFISMFEDFVWSLNFHIRFPKLMKFSPFRDLASSYSGYWICPFQHPFLWKLNHHRATKNRAKIGVHDDPVKWNRDGTNNDAIWNVFMPFFFSSVSAPRKQEGKRWKGVEIKSIMVGKWCGIE